jgi:hypothetical protein
VQAAGGKHKRFEINSIIICAALHGVLIISTSPQTRMRELTRQENIVGNKFAAASPFFGMQMQLSY